MEGVECACMGRGRVCIWKGLSVHGERVCIWKGLGVRAWGEEGSVYGRVWVCMHGEREGVYMEGVQCACMGERESVCIWKV